MYTGLPVFSHTAFSASMTCLKNRLTINRVPLHRHIISCRGTSEPFCYIWISYVWIYYQVTEKLIDLINVDNIEKEPKSSCKEYYNIIISFYLKNK